MDQDEYSCVICEADCLYDCILCDDCSNWTHFKCMIITESEKAHLHGGREQESFYCVKCSSENGRFDYESSLHRLSEASHDGIETLTSVALIEAIMMKQLSASNNTEEIFDYTGLDIDRESCKLFKRYNTPNHVALRSTRGGNCVFNSLSILLFGNEESSVDIRVKTCVYMALHREGILENIPADLLSISSDFDEALINCSRYNSWSDSISIFAAASALSVNIKMIYPPINGLIDSNIGILNKALTPLGKNPTRTIMLMWTGGFTKGLNYEGDLWFPNHFVPVVSSTLNSDATEIDAPKSSIMKDKFEESTDNLTSNSENENSTYLNGSSEIPLLPGGSRNNGQFLETDEIIDILVNNKKPVVGEMPLGKKENSYFVVSNRKNIKRKSKDLKFKFNDDCGAWTLNSLKTVYYLIDKKESNVKYRYIEHKSGKFYIRTRTKNTLLNPQPKKSEMLVLKKRYSKLVRDNNFQRRISYFENGSVAIFEYKGSFPSI